MTALRRAPIFALLALCLLPAGIPARGQTPAQEQPEPGWEEITLPGGAIYGVETFDQVVNPDFEQVTRIVHAVPGGGDIDVRIDGELFVAGLSFGERSDYLETRAGRRSIEILPAGGDQPVYEERVELREFDRNTVLLHLGTAGLALHPIGDDAARAVRDIARLRLLNLRTTGPVDLLVDDEVLFARVPQGQSSDYIDLSAMGQNLALRGPGQEQVAFSGRFDLEGHLAYTLVALDGPDASSDQAILLEDAVLELEQRMLAAGLGFYTSDRGAEWDMQARSQSHLRRTESNADGVVFARDQDGRLWRSLDGGEGWNAQDIERDRPARVLSISPDYRQDYLALAITTEDWRPFRYERGRSDWIEVVLETGQRYQVGAASYSPDLLRDELVLVGAAEGIYRSDDSGQTWRRVDEAEGSHPAFGPEGGPGDLQGMRILPGLDADPDARTVLAWNDSGLYRSDDSGRSWRRLPLEATRIRDLAISNAWPVDPVIAVALGDAGRMGAVSHDGGASWQWIDAPAGSTAGGVSVAMARDFGVASVGLPRDRAEVEIYLPLLSKHQRHAARYVGSREMYLATDGEGLWRSYDAGRTWPVELRDQADSSLRSAAPASLLYLPGSAGSQVMVGTRAAGLYRSEDGGRSFMQVDALPRGDGQVIHRLLASTDYERDATIFAATESGLWVSRDRGTSWQATSAEAPARVLAISPSFGEDGTLVVDGQISRDGGRSFEALPGSEGMRWTAVAFSPQYSEDGRIWRAHELDEESEDHDPLQLSTDGGASWQDIDDSSLARRHIHALLPLAIGIDPLRIFAGTDRGLVASLDDGDSWDRVSDVPGQDVRSLAGTVIESPVTTGVIVAAGDRQVVWSTNRGVSWETSGRDVDGGLDIALSEDIDPAPGIDTRSIIQVNAESIFRLDGIEVAAP